MIALYPLITPRRSSFCTRDCTADTDSPVASESWANVARPSFSNMFRMHVSMVDLACGRSRALRSGATTCHKRSLLIPSPCIQYRQCRYPLTTIGVIPLTIPISVHIATHHFRYKSAVFLLTQHFTLIISTIILLNTAIFTNISFIKRIFYSF